MLTVKVLDHGFVTLRNVAGPTRRVVLGSGRTVSYHGQTAELPPTSLIEFDADDIDPAQSARMSFDQMDSDRPREMDLKLADYLMRNRHTSPFEMIVVWLEMKLPIFVARQFVRHRTVAINEVSGRYVTLPAEWYIPKVVGGKAKSAKQGQEDNLHPAAQDQFRRTLDNHCRDGYEEYTRAIGNGVAPEHARMLLSLNHYTHWLWKQDLHNLMHFLSLRTGSHAQVEAQAYARAILELMDQALPESMALFRKYRLQG